MTLTKENKLVIEGILTTIATHEFNEDLLWVRPWTKEEFDERNYKAKIEKIQKDHNFTLDEAIESFIVDYYQNDYIEEDFNEYVDLLDEIVESYYSVVDKLNLEFNGGLEDYTKEGLTKKLKWNPTDYLFQTLQDEVLPYTDNYEGLKALMIA